jgi:AbrB family looped-hinge helix DNA binding protein
MTSRTRLVRSLRGGQITIPAEFRRALGIGESSPLRVTLENGELRITPVEVRSASSGTPWLRDLYGHFAAVREEVEERGISEDEINSDIDAAIFKHHLDALRAQERA